MQYLSCHYVLMLPLRWVSKISISLAPVCTRSYIYIPEIIERVYEKIEVIYTYFLRLFGIGRGVQCTGADCAGRASARRAVGVWRLAWHARVGKSRRRAV